MTIQYIDVSMPDKRSRRIKNYETLKDIEENVLNQRTYFSLGLLIPSIQTGPNVWKMFACMIWWPIMTITVKKVRENTKSSFG